MLTDAYVGWWVGGFGKIRCLRNIWTAPKESEMIFCLPLSLSVLISAQIKIVTIGD